MRSALHGSAATGIGAVAVASSQIVSARNTTTSSTAEYQARLDGGAMSKGSDGYGSSPAMNSFSVGAHFAHSGPLAKWPSSVSISKYFASTPARVSLSITAGGLFALYEGIEKLRHPHELESPLWAVGILLVAIVAESLSLRTAVHESRGAKGS